VNKDARKNSHALVTPAGCKTSRGDSLKTIGLLGGMSWQSTLGYYRAINEGITNKLGGLHSAKIAMYSVDFAPIEKR
jgi:hypothetical protein